METIYALHVPSIFSYQQSIAEDPTGEGSRNYHCSKMANPNMVACLDENAGRQSSTSTQQKETAVIHPLYPKLELLMCHLSGDLLKAKEFRQKLQGSSCSPGDQAPQASTKLTTRSRNHSVVDGTLIPFRPLYRMV